MDCNTSLGLRVPLHLSSPPDPPKPDSSIKYRPEPAGLPALLVSMAAYSLSIRACAQSSRCLRSSRVASRAHAHACRRAYHSHDHPSPSDDEFGSTEKAILSAAYKHIPEHGFSHRALGLGARDAGYLDISPGAFPDGAFSLIRYHLVTQRDALAARRDELPKSHGAPLGVGAKVAALTWERLLANKDVIHRWQEVRTWVEIDATLPPLHL